MHIQKYYTKLYIKYNFFLIVGDQWKTQEACVKKAPMDHDLKIIMTYWNTDMKEERKGLGWWLQLPIYIKRVAYSSPLSFHDFSSICFYNVFILYIGIIKDSLCLCSVL